MMSTAEIINKIKGLPHIEQLQILQSIETALETEQPEISEKWRKEIYQRRQQRIKGEINVRPLSEFLSELF